MSDGNTNKREGGPVFSPESQSFQPDLQRIDKNGERFPEAQQAPTIGKSPHEKGNTRDLSEVSRGQFSEEALTHLGITDRNLINRIREAPVEERMKIITNRLTQHNLDKENIGDDSSDLQELVNNVQRPD